MALVKRNGQLFEEKDEDTLMNRVNKVGSPVPPITSLGAQSIGASPDSAKMAGTAAQKTNAIRQAVAPKEQTLAGAQRLEGPQQAGEADQQAQAKAQQLSQLGSLGTRVQNKIEGMIAQSTTNVQLGAQTANESRLAQSMGWMTQGDIEANRPQLEVLQSKIQAYSANPTEEGLADLVASGMPKNQVYSLTGLMETGEQATANSVANAMADDFTMSDLDVTEFGYDSLEQLSADLGQDVSQMTVPEFQEAIQQMQMAEFDKIDEIKAQLRALPRDSARAKQLIQQLKDLGDVGTTGTEATVQEAADAIDTADVVEIGGREMEIKDLLSDDGIYDLIT